MRSCSMSVGGFSVGIYTSHLSTTYLGLQITLSSQVSHLNPMTDSTDRHSPREHRSNVSSTRRVGLRGESHRIRASIHHSRIFRGKGRKTQTYYSSLIAVPTFTQTKVLFTFDPRAFHAIYVKDQDVYEESDIFISYDHVTCMWPRLSLTCLQDLRALPRSWVAFHFG